jgi:hypothetical protein
MPCRWPTQPEHHLPVPTRSRNPVQGSEITIGWNNLGTYNLSVVETSVHGCDTLQQGTINVFDQPVADAGSPATICPGNSHTFTDARAFNYTTLWWTTSGDGAFDDPARLDATYTPGPADRLSGEITCTLTVQDWVRHSCTRLCRR